MPLIATIDFETTGVDPVIDRVVEAARVVVQEPERVVTRAGDQWRFHPGERGVPPEASAVHHLTMADLEGRPSFTLDEWWNITPAANYLAAHSVAFDRAFVDAAPIVEPHVGPNQETRPWICTLKCARVAWPDAPAYGNQTLRYWLGCEPDLSLCTHAHSALYDATVTAEILLRLLAHFDGDLERMVRISSEPSLLRQCHFGQHRGALWRDVPRSYLEWILRQEGERAFDPDVRHTANYHLNGGNGVR